MIQGIHPSLQTLLGTLFTWGLTAAGSAGVFFLDSEEKGVLDGSLGFAAGDAIQCVLKARGDSKKDDDLQTKTVNVDSSQWKRILMLIVAITMHNIPEGLAVGVGFGAAGASDVSKFSSARNLAVGIGIQNFPEGLAVSLPLKAAGLSNWRAFWFGQLSGLVEPIAGILGYFLISIVEPLLPFALAFAAGAMIFVVVDDIIPEAQHFGNGKIASWASIAGFLVMMILEVALG